MPRLFISSVKGKGRCLFAGEPIAEGGVIDTNSVLMFPKAQTEELKPPLQCYPFAWDHLCDCIALGSVSIANHSNEPNAYLQRDHVNLLIRLVANRGIEKGEEITYHYRVPLWFEPEPPARL
jgi:SET domain-containing protein